MWMLLSHSKADLTESSFAVVLISLRPPSAAAAQPPQDDVDVGEDDERWRQDGTVVKGHDQLIPLELPHLIGNRLHLKERVTVESKRRELDFISRFD